MQTKTHTPIELELKLACSAETATRLVPYLKQLCNGEAQTLQLENTYFDTPDSQLQAHKVALRLRRQNDVLLQTIKCAGQVSGGMSARPEWESAYTGQFDFSNISDTEVRELLQKQVGKLEPSLSTNFTRLRWHYQAGDTRVELVLDRGEITAGDARAPLCEVELELLDGQADVLCTLAQQLAEQFALFPSPLSKAMRGNHLIKPPALLSTDQLSALSTPKLFDVLCQNLPDTANSFDTATRNVASSALSELQRRLPASLQCSSTTLKEQSFAASLLKISLAIYAGEVQ